MRIALYTRVSTQEQAEHGYSIDEQSDRLNKYCDALGWTVAKTYTDAGFSGSNTNRPAMQDLIRDAKKRSFDKVLVYKLDRLSRSQKDTLWIIEDVLLKNGIDFVSISENFDTSSPFGRAMIGILAVFAQLEREQIKERMEMGRVARAKSGLYNGGCYNPIGYDYKDGQLIVNEYEKMIVQRVFKEYLGGSNAFRIAKQLNDDGLSARGNYWSQHVVQKILSHKIYIGYVTFKGKEYKGIHDPIIDEKDFLAVQEMVKIRSEQFVNFQRREGKATSYLGGMCYCGKCGSKIWKRKFGHGNSIVAHYACSARNYNTEYDRPRPHCDNKAWRMDDLDNAVFNEIRKLALDPDRTIRTEEQDDRPAIKAEIDKIDKRISAEMDLYSIQEIPIDILHKRIKDLSDRKKKLEAEYEKAEQKHSQVMDTGEMIRSFDDVFERGDYTEIRTLVRMLIDRIIVTDDDIEIHWRFI